MDGFVAQAWPRPCGQQQGGHEAEGQHGEDEGGAQEGSAGSPSGLQGTQRQRPESLENQTERALGHGAAPADRDGAGKLASTLERSEPGHRGAALHPRPAQQAAGGRGLSGCPGPAPGTLYRPPGHTPSAVPEVGEQGRARGNWSNGAGEEAVRGRGRWAESPPLLQHLKVLCSAEESDAVWKRWPARTEPLSWTLERKQGEGRRREYCLVPSLDLEGFLPRHLGDPRAATENLTS